MLGFFDGTALGDIIGAVVGTGVCVVVVTVVVTPLAIVVVVLRPSSRAPIAPAICRMLGALFEKVDAANAPPDGLARMNCAPSSERT